MRLHYLAIGQKNKKIYSLIRQRLSKNATSIFPDFSHQTRRFVQSMEGQLFLSPGVMNKSRQRSLKNWAMGANCKNKSRAAQAAESTLFVPMCLCFCVPCFSTWKICIWRIWICFGWSLPWVLRVAPLSGPAESGGFFHLFVILRQRRRISFWKFTFGEFELV